MTLQERRQLVREIATKLILDAARGIDPLDINQTVDEREELSARWLFDHGAQLARDVRHAILAAEITVEISDNALSGAV